METTFINWGFDFSSLYTELNNKTLYNNNNAISYYGKIFKKSLINEINDGYDYLFPYDPITYNQLYRDGRNIIIDQGLFGIEVIYLVECLPVPEALVIKLKDIGIEYNRHDSFPGSSCFYITFYISEPNNGLTIEDAKKDWGWLNYISKTFESFIDYHVIQYRK